MTNSYRELAKSILENVGGEKNIASMTHCMTRLRLNLKDDKKANIPALKNTNGVVNAQFSGGHLQIVIGVTVNEVFEALLALTTIQQSGEKSAGSFVATITAVFAPILGILCATGLLKGVLMILVAAGILSETSGTYTILYNAAESLFYFLPIVIGFLSAKKFAVNEMTGLMLGLALCAPALTAIAPSAVAVASGSADEPLGRIFGLRYYTTLFGIPVVFPSEGNYTSTVVPIIIIVYFASFVEKAAKKIVPREIKSFGVPLVTFFVSLSAGLLFIGPIVAILTDFIGTLAQIIFEHFPVLGGALVGGLWQVLVIFGLHWSLIPLRFINLASNHFDMVLTPYFPASFACLAATLAVVIKTRDRQTKSIGISALLSAITGITEPALYGITLPRKKPFVFSCIGSALGGIIISASKSYAYISGGLGIFGFSDFMMTKEYAEQYGVAQNMTGGVCWALCAAICAMISTFLLTLFFYKEDTAQSTPAISPTADSGEKEHIIITSPLSGTVVNLADIEDKAFADSGLGSGIAIDPADGTIFAPADGVIAVLPETYHAVCIVADSGAMILIHIGYNTAELKGKGFTAHVSEGSPVKKGDKIISIDLAAIKNEGYSLITPVIIGNSSEYTFINTLKNSGDTVQTGERLFELT